MIVMNTECARITGVPPPMTPDGPPGSLNAPFR